MSFNQSLNPQKGFRDLYPSNKAQQEYIFSTIKEVSRTFGYELYDGPILEDIAIYLEKTSRELIDRQTFQVVDKKDKTLVLRPEMTPSLARMVAKNAHQLVFPLKLTNIGLRFRYEAPQKGREREFYQADFDILGSDSLVADAEILATAVRLFTAFGATEKDFSVHINSRSLIEEFLGRSGIVGERVAVLLSLIDRKDKISDAEFQAGLEHIVSADVKKIILNFLDPTKHEKTDAYFAPLFQLLKLYGADQYVTVDPTIVRGLDYYTGLVFEVKELGEMRRSLLGGGRYDNLVSQFNEKLHIPGVGFATSDVVLTSFLNDKGLLPPFPSKPTRVLVTIFSEDLVNESIEIVTMLRNNHIPAELFPDTDKKIDKQLKYADKNNIPYVIIVGPEEAQHQQVILKSLTERSQQTIANTKDAILFAMHK